MIIRNKENEIIFEGDKSDLRDVDLSGADLWRVDLRGAILRDANLRGANLMGTDLRDADLRDANLRHADLRGAILRDANLRDTDLRGADLTGADLMGANLRGADLRHADLWGADLWRADLSGAKLYNTFFPSPTMVLLAYWGEVSDNLCLELMRFDAQNCPNGNISFQGWVETNECPFNKSNCYVQRSANFVEKRELWSPGPAKSAYELMCMVLLEQCEFGK